MLQGFLRFFVSRSEIPLRLLVQEGFFPSIFFGFLIFEYFRIFSPTSGHGGETLAAPSTRLQLQQRRSDPSACFQHCISWFYLIVYSAKRKKSLHNENRKESLSNPFWKRPIFYFSTCSCASACCGVNYTNGSATRCGAIYSRSTHIIFSHVSSFRFANHRCHSSTNQIFPCSLVYQFCSLSELS